MTLSLERKRQETQKMLEDSEAEEYRLELAMGSDKEVQATERMDALTKALEKQKVASAFYRKALEKLK